MAKKAKKPARREARKSWSKADLRTLGAMLKKGATSTAIGRELRRSSRAVQQKVYAMGLSLQKAAKKAKKIGRKAVKVAKVKVLGTKASSTVAKRPVAAKRSAVPKRPASARIRPSKPRVARQPITSGMNDTAAPVAAVPAVEAKSE